jgi:DNA polymerase (family X)
MRAMALAPADIAILLREIAQDLGLEGERHRARAYERAASSIDGVHDLERLVAERRLTELPGVGRAIASLVEELWQSGSAGLLLRLRARWPKVLAELAALPGIGVARARRIHEGLRPSTVEEVAALCVSGRVRALPGFGPATERRVLEAIRGRHERRGELLLGDAATATARLAGVVRRLSGTRAVEAAGPARRCVETVDALALAAASVAPGEVVAALRAQAAVAALDEIRPGMARGRLVTGVALDVCVAEPERFGVALVRATGSAAHVTALERRARDLGTPLDELRAPDERTLYAALGLPLLPPEVRDGTDEIEAALAGDDFADLVSIGDVRGAVHCHTTWSDGSGSIAEMAAAAAARGLEYLTITDHSPSAGYAGGLPAERLREQWDEIARVQPDTPVRLLRGSESDILADGSLDHPPELLAGLDVVIASIHRRHKLDADGMTRRLVTALRQPVFKVWGHALGRILLHREPVACHFDEVLDALDGARVAVEINGDPRRLDLEPALARRARARGARFVLSSDAHAPAQLDHLRLAVAMARRARIRRHEVLNTLAADAFVRAVRPL